MLSHHDPIAQNLAARCLGDIGDPCAAGALAAVVEQNRTISNEYPELLDVARSAVSALETILEKAPDEIPGPDLKRIARLPDVIRHPGDMALGCAHLRDLALRMANG
jgi:HEAT repeat protein